MNKKLLFPLLLVGLVLMSLPAFALISSDDVAFAQNTISRCAGIDDTNIDSCNQDTQTSSSKTADIDVNQLIALAKENVRNMKYVDMQTPACTGGQPYINVFVADATNEIDALKMSTVATWYNYNDDDCYGMQSDAEKKLCSYPFFVLSDETEVDDIRSFTNHIEKIHDNPHNDLLCANFHSTFEETQLSFPGSTWAGVTTTGGNGHSYITNYAGDTSLKTNWNNANYGYNSKIVLKESNEVIFRFRGPGTTLYASDEASAVKNMEVFLQKSSWPKNNRDIDNLIAWSELRPIYRGDDSQLKEKFSSDHWQPNFDDYEDPRLSTTYLTHWKDYSSIVIISDTEKESLIHASYIASLLNAPLFVTGYDDENFIAELVQKTNFIFIGETPNKGTEYALMQENDALMSLSMQASDSKTMLSFEYNLVSALFSDVDTPDFKIPAYQKYLIYNGEDSCTSDTVTASELRVKDVSPSSRLFCGNSLLVPYLAISHGQLIARDIGKSPETALAAKQLNYPMDIKTFDALFTDSRTSPSSAKANALLDDTKVVVDEFSSKRFGSSDVDRENLYLTFVGGPNDVPFSRNLDVSVPTELFLSTSIDLPAKDKLVEEAHSGWIFSPTVSTTSVLAMQNLFIMPPGYTDVRKMSDRHKGFIETPTTAELDVSNTERISEGDFSVMLASDTAHLTNPFDLVRHQTGLFAYAPFFGSEFVSDFSIHNGLFRDQAESMTENAPLIVEGVSFVTGTTELRQEDLSSSLDILNSIALMLQDRPNMRVKITSHADYRPIRGNNNLYKNNDNLSLHRSIAIKNLLVAEYGINPARVEVAGEGSKKPRRIAVTEDGFRWLEQYANGQRIITLNEDFFTRTTFNGDDREKALALARRIEVMPLGAGSPVDQGSNSEQDKEIDLMTEPLRRNLLFFQGAFTHNTFRGFKPFVSGKSDPNPFSVLIFDSPYVASEDIIDNSFAPAWKFIGAGARAVYSFDRKVGLSDTADYISETLVSSIDDGLLQGDLAHALYMTYIQNQYPEDCGPLVLEGSSCDISDITDRALKSYAKHLRLIGDPLAMLVPVVDEDPVDEVPTLLFTDVGIASTDLFRHYLRRTGLSSSDVETTPFEKAAESFLRKGELSYSYLSRTLPFMEGETVRVSTFVASSTPVTAAYALSDNSDDDALRRMTCVKSDDDFSGLDDKRTMYECSTVLSLPDLSGEIRERYDSYRNALPFDDLYLSIYVGEERGSTLTADEYLRKDTRHLRVFEDNADISSEIVRPTNPSAGLIQGDKILFTVDLSAITGYDSSTAETTDLQPVTEYSKFPVTLLKDNSDTDDGFTVKLFFQAPFFGGCLFEKTLTVEDSLSPSQAKGFCADNADYTGSPTSVEQERVLQKFCAQNYTGPTEYQFEVGLDEVFPQDDFAKMVGFENTPISISFLVDMEYYIPSSNDVSSSEESSVAELATLLSESKSGELRVELDTNRNDDRYDVVMCHNFPDTYMSSRTGSRLATLPETALTYSYPGISIVTEPLMGKGNEHAGLNLRWY